MALAHFGSVNAQGLGLAVDAFSAGTLGVDSVIERAIAIEQDAHQSALFPVGIFDTALGFRELLVVTRLAGWLWEEQGAAKALGTKAIGVLKLVGGMHA